MALTHELDDPGSPIRQFFETRFPRPSFSAVSKEWYATVRVAEVICPLPDGVNPGTTGTAFDYRARLCWARLELETTVAALGARVVRARGREHLAGLFSELGVELERIAPGRCAGVLESEREERLCRICYVLALYEQLYRSTQAGAGSPLLDVADDAEIEDLIQLAPQAAAADLASMAQLFSERCPDLIDAPAVLNPTFDGSAQIGGADADLIADGTLLELKTTKQDKFERVRHLYQLLGYVLLDFSGQYEIEAVAVYLARRGILIRWPLDELLGSCCDTTAIGELRQDFRGAVAATSGTPWL